METGRQEEPASPISPSGEKEPGRITSGQRAEMLMEVQQAKAERAKTRLEELASYVRKQRDGTEDKRQKEVFTNILAWIILIEQGE
jgi:hypothetical protein